MQSESIALLTKAVVKVQSQLTGVSKDATNPFFNSKYATLDACWDVIRPLLAENGLAIIQTTEMVENGAVLVTRLCHESGEWVRGDYPLNPVKNDPQGLGSSTTYARRYSLQAIIGLTPADDDGNAATGNTQSKAKTTPAAARKTRGGTAAPVKTINDLTETEYSQMRTMFAALINEPFDMKQEEIEKACLPEGVKSFADVTKKDFPDVMMNMAKMKSTWEYEHEEEAF